MSARETRSEALAHAVRIEVAHAGAGQGYDSRRVVAVARGFEQYLEPTKRDARGRFTRR